MGAFIEAQQAFEKLHTIIPHNPEVTRLQLSSPSKAENCLLSPLLTTPPPHFKVIYQIANLYEQTNDLHNAIKWFNILSTRVPSDPVVLARMGQIFNKMDDESQAFHYHMESYRHYPVSLDVIS